MHNVNDSLNVLHFLTNDVYVWLKVCASSLYARKKPDAVMNLGLRIVPFVLLGY